MQAANARGRRGGARFAALAAAALLAFSARSMAGEYEAVEVGTSGLILKNSAPHQRKLYIKAEDALGDRICCLLDDMDTLLEKLHALPPQNAGSPVLTEPSDPALAELYALTLGYNPKLQQMRSELGMLAARTRQAGAKTDPTLGVSFEDLPAPIPLPQVFHKPNAQGLTISLSQMFDSYGKRGLRRDISRKDEQLKELAIAQMELDMLWDVENMYYELLDVKAERRSLDANIELMKLLLELARTKYSAGFTMQAEVLNAEVQLSTMEQMRTEKSIEEQQMGVRLAGMLGNPPGFDPASLSLPESYPLPPSADFDTTALTEAALARRPDKAAVDLGIQRAQLEVLMAKADYHPDYELMAEYMLAPGMHDSIKAGISFPLSLHKEEKQDARVQEMHAEGEMTRAEGEVIKNNLATQIKDLQLEMQMHSRLAEMYRSALVPQARLALESAISGYSADMMDLSDLLMAQQNLLTQQTELERNYVHILHVLADLQVLTAGAFDPAPYLVATTSLEDESAAVKVPPAEAAPPQPRADGGTAPDGSFVEGLELPDEDGAAESDKSQAEPVDGPPAPPAGTPTAPPDDESGFYQPYKPKDNRGGGK